MKILGINALNHDAAIKLIEDDKILFAAHAERYSGIKNDSNLNKEMFRDMEQYGTPVRLFILKIHTQRNSDNLWQDNTEKYSV